MPICFRCGKRKKQGHWRKRGFICGDCIDNETYGVHSISNRNKILGKTFCPKCGKLLIVKEKINESNCYHLWGKITDEKVLKEIRRIRKEGD